MRTRARWLLALLALCLLVSPHCQAQGAAPAVSLTVQDSTVGMIAKMIGAVAGIEVSAAADVAGQKVATFEVKDATLEAALQSLCQATGLQLQKQGDGYRIVKGEAEGAAATVAPLVVDDMEGNPGARWRDVMGGGPAGLVADQEIVKQGQISGKWDADAAPRYISSRRIPHDWTGYESLSFWVHSAKATNAVMAVLLYSNNDQTDKPDYLRGLLQIDWEGWREVKLYLQTSFRHANAPVGLSKIDSLRFAFEGWPGLTKHVPGTVLRLDDLRLLPADPGQDKLVIFHPDTDAALMVPLTCAKEPTRTGGRVARWVSTVSQPSLHNSAIPRDWSAYGYLNLWVHCAQPTGAKIMLMAESLNPATDRQDYYYVIFPLDWQGWKLLTFPKQDFRTTREPLGWDQIHVLRLYSAGFPALDPGDGTSLCLDEIWLSKEPPEQEQ